MGVLDLEGAGLEREFVVAALGDHLPGLSWHNRIILIKLPPFPTKPTYFEDHPSYLLPLICPFTLLFLIGLDSGLF